MAQKTDSRGADTGAPADATIFAQFTDGDAAQGAAPLETFLANAGGLTDAEKLAIVNQAILLLEGYYVHLPLKRAMHAVDPLQRLRLLRHRHARLTETRFHREMTSIFTSVRDLHTNYMLPAPYANVAVTLPFLIEDCFEDGEWRYLVTATSGAMPDPALQKGVRITHWNGVPIGRAVTNAADRHAGSNVPARHSRGLAGLTQRALIVSPPPDEEWVSVTYAGLDGTVREARFQWQVRGLPSPPAGGEATAEAAAMGYDLETVAVQSVRQELFAPQVAKAEEAIAAAAGDPAEFVQGTASTMPNIFTANPVLTASGTYGYIRIRNFKADHEQFVREFIRLAELMPAAGLIIDVRDNGGGIVWCGERLLQTLTPKRIEPELLQFINTPLTDQLARANSPGTSGIDLTPWKASIARAVETGAAFSCGFPITDPALCNNIGQRYYGPVVLITNARCYSTTDFFAAGFQDHNIGPVLGVDNNTGAGGANVWEHGLLLQLGAPLAPLPRGANMRVAIRRSVRVGAQAGTELEDLGVVPDARHRMTRRDLLERNVDLIEKAATMLAGKPVFRLDATATKVGGNLRLVIATANLDRVDIELNGRPQRSIDVAGAGATVDVPTTLSSGVATLRGFKDGNLAAARKVAF